MEFGLRGKKALVGGASKGLGLACARALAEEGCEVALISRSEANLQKAASSFPSAQKVITMAADLSREAGIRKCFEKADAWGSVDILVNNTGGPPAGRSFELDEKAWSQAYESLLLYVKKMCDHFVPGMIARHWGRIITLTSFTVKEPVDNLVLSNIFRTGVTAYQKILARELAASGITVNTVLPGAYRTERYEQLIENMVKRTGKNREQVEKEIIARLPQRRFQEPEELAALVAFLASERASAITGAAIPAEGGMLAGLLS